MAKKQFKTESKKLLDMMINSIYTHKEIFLRELISNGSDAIDKLYFRSLTDSSITLKRGDYEIRLIPNKEARTLVIKDNGIGMTEKELENNLGTIARSGSLDFKKNADHQDAPTTEEAEASSAEAAEAEDDGADKASPEKPIDIIGQFGVGFYSAFMVSSEIKVESKAYGSDEAWCWVSRGVDGYTIDPCEKAENGTTITLTLKPDTDDEKYSDFLEEWKIRELVRKYSDYIRYPIRMQVTRSRKKEGSPDDKPEYEEYKEDTTLNSMVPLWKKPTSAVSEEEYNNFYSEKFFDYEAPLKVIRQHSEGTSDFVSLLFIPSHAPYNYYTREYEKGLQLYSSGVLIMDKCKDLLPDYYSFVHGLVDSSDLSLNISREMLQHDRQLKIIARAVEKKISQELKKMLENEREKYETFFKAFGTQLKYGIYQDYGMHKDPLQDLLLFASSYKAEAPAADEAAKDQPDAAEEKKAFVPTSVTLKEYVSRMKEGQDKIYYAPGVTKEQIALLPQVEAVVAKGYEVLYLTEEIDEFALQVMNTYMEKSFSNVCKDDVDLSTEEEKETLKEENDLSKDMFEFMKNTIGAPVTAVRFTNMLQNHAAALSSEGELSVNMEKALSRMPGAEENEMFKAQLVLEINMNHPIAQRLKELFVVDQDKLAKYSKILYAQARLVSGLELTNASEISDLVVGLMTE
ncbi:MAG: molecular chaperone HtpG [Firmicutes bacterium]|nr:molecular chaperone HtpG [Bacillota bacterium]